MTNDEKEEAGNVENTGMEESTEWPGRAEKPGKHRAQAPSKRWLLRMSV